MIIVSQDKTMIFNFDNIIRLFIGFAEENKKKSIRCETVNTYEELGIYTTEERAKEVLKEVIKIYKITKMTETSINRVSDKVGAIAIQNSFVYEMPLE